MKNNFSTVQFKIVTLDGDTITASLDDEIGPVYLSDDVLYVNGIPARLSTASPTILTECVWKYDDDDRSYATVCGQGFMFSYHPPEAAFRFCPYCGRIINWQGEKGDEW